MRFRVTLECGKYWIMAMHNSVEVKYLEAPSKNQAMKLLAKARGEWCARGWEAFPYLKDRFDMIEERNNYTCE